MVDHIRTYPLEHDHHCGHVEDVAVECAGDDTLDVRSSLDYETEDPEVSRYIEFKNLTRNKLQIIIDIYTGSSDQMILKSIALCSL